MARFTVVGAGVTGSGVARELASQGHDVVVVTRRGTGPQERGVSLVAADAANGHRLAEIASGSEALFNCANPPYHRWPQEWPALAASLLHAAEHSDAVLVTLGNLYPYGAPTRPMAPTDPMTATYRKAQIRAQMWRDALLAHQEGRVRAAEVRASDFIGPRANALLGDRVIAKVLAGKPCNVLGNPDALHSWTFVDDVVRTLVACATDRSSWGRVWHVPTNPPRSARNVINDYADAAGLSRVPVRSIPGWVLRTAGVVSPLMRELPKTLYQFQNDFVIDDHESREQFGIVPTPWSHVITAALSSTADSRQVFTLV